MMRKFTDYLNEAQALMEANVTNPEVITQYAAKIASKLNNEVGKAWFNKKVRSLLINTPDYLNQINPENIDQRRMPPYMLAAIEKGEAIFSFDPNKTTLIELTQTLEHIADWFNRLNDVAQSKPDPQNLVAVEDKILAQRELSKIMKLSVDGAAVAADAWFKAMGNRIKGPKQGVEGGKVVMEWPDGYYAISFNDRTAMMRDGKDLNNCLQHGTYWDSVKNGTNYVIAIRKPNDEAVVGMRFTTPASSRTKTLDVIECKGKNNKPPQAQYLPYVVDLLKKLDANPATTQDLKMAGIHFNKGEYGTFQDVAELVHDEDGIKIWRTIDKFLARVGSTPIQGVINDDHVTSIETDAKMSVIVAVLNGLGLPADGYLINRLENSFIYEVDGRFGTPKDVGEPVGSADGHEMFKVDERVFVFEGDFNVFTFELGKGRRQSVIDILDVEGDVKNTTIAACLNVLGFGPSSTCEDNALFDNNLVFDGQRYGTFDELGTLVARRGNVGVFQLGKRPKWASVDRGQLQALFMRAGTGRFHEVATKESNNPDVGFVIRNLLQEVPVTWADEPSKYGVINTPKGVVASKAALFANPTLITTGLNDQNPKALQWGGDTEGPIMTKELIAFLKAEGKLSAKEQATLIKMLAADKKQPAFIEEKTSHKVFDLDVKQYDVHLPIILFDAFKALDLKTPRQSREDVLRGIKYAEHFIQNNPASYRFVNFDLTMANEMDLENEFSKLRLLAARAAERIRNETREREENKDKYATDLSSRFAALNALRKVKR